MSGDTLGTRSAYRIGLLLALGALTAYGLVSALVLVRSVLVLLVISAFLAVGLNPTVEYLQRRGLPRGGAVGTVLLTVILGFIGFLFAIVPPIVDQTSQFVDKAPEYVDTLLKNHTLRDLDDRYQVLQRVKEALQSENLAGNVFGGVLGVGKVVFSAVFSTITVLTLTLYMMSSLPSMKSAAYKLAPASRRTQVAVLSDDILDKIGGYVAGALTIALTAGVSSFLVLLATDVPYPVALALVVSLTDLVPVIGATLGAIVVSGVAFAHDVRTGVVIAVFYLIYQQVENYVLYPRIMKRSVDVSPLVTIVAVLIGGSLMGIVGALIAIPIAAAIQLVMAEIVIPHQDAA
jgi:predicted PurR-regulated permease PerM